ncbi:MAG: threonine ammonia-lyase, biosynthetic [Porticoccus sp.]|jgi:threonine dehydratase|nr:threonine ammonia-lyase, biosynthetic [Porticoccus sp.]
MFKSYVKQIEDAKIYDLVVKTPVDEAPQLSLRLKNRILLKREDLQPIFSFKLRGAYNKMLSLKKSELDKGVIAASAGNHAQGLAMAAKKIGANATIVMPTTTPIIKVNAVKSLGAEVLLKGDSYDEASDYAQKLVIEKDMIYIHPFDDPDVIAGQGTIAMEILEQVSDDLEAIFIAVGGGGLCAGMAAYIKTLKPNIKIIAVEAEDSACLNAAMKAGERVELKHVGIFADGTAVAQIGKETFRILKDTVDEVITVSVDEICASIKDTFDDTRSICEPAGALGLAGLKKYVETKGIQGKTLLAVECGANINFDRLRYISERTEIGEKREAILAVTIPEKPGSFKSFCMTLDKRNITEFNYRKGDSASAHIFVGLQVSSDSDRKILTKNLADEGYPVVDMTDNEIAKLHIRHMVGGRAQKPIDEMIFTFEFPERPGALMKFLIKLGDRWNISMFHYRNHGSENGRVLAGLEISAVDRRDARKFFDDLGFEWTEETENPAYQFFLN